MNERLTNFERMIKIGTSRNIAYFNQTKLLSLLLQVGAGALVACQASL
jgi:hypothetical protein